MFIDNMHSLITSNSTGLEHECGSPDLTDSVTRHCRTDAIAFGRVVSDRRSDRDRYLSHPRPEPAPHFKTPEIAGRCWSVGKDTGRFVCVSSSDAYRRRSRSCAADFIHLTRKRRFFVSRSIETGADKTRERGKSLRILQRKRPSVGFTSHHARR